MRPRAVTFDAGGTLIEVAEPVGATYARVAARHGIRATPGDVEQRFRAAFASAPPLAFPGADPDSLARRERDWWQAIVRAALGPAEPAALEAAFAELFGLYARGAAWRVFPDVLPALSALRAAGVRIGVVSNFDRRLVGLLADLGITPLIDVTVHSTATGAAKPEPAIFRAALDRLGVAAADAVHVGDGFREDVGGARGAGMHGVLVCRAGSPPADLPVVRRLTDLPAVLAALR